MLTAATVPTYILIALPLLATLADLLWQLLGSALPVRTRLSVAGGLVLLVAALLVRAMCPKTIALTQSTRKLIDSGGVDRLKSVWREELARRINDVGLRDAVRSIRLLAKPPHTKSSHPLRHDATLNDVLFVIDRAEFLNLDRMREVARSNFEHVSKTTQFTLGALLIAGWMLSAGGLLLAAHLIFFPTLQGGNMDWLFFRGTAESAAGIWRLVPSDDPTALIEMGEADVKTDAGGALVRKGSSALRIIVAASSPARRAPQVNSAKQCPTNQSRCLGGVEFCCNSEAISYCNGLWDDCSP